MQKRLSAAFDAARTRVGEMLSEVSESVMGAAVVRAYGLDEQTHRKVQHAISERYKAEVVAHFRAATLWPLSSVFYAAALSLVIVLGRVLRARRGALTFGQVTAFLFLADVFLHVFTDLPEIYSETQNAIAGVAEDPGGARPAGRGGGAGARARALERGALAVRAEDVRYRYRTGPEVLHGISLDVPRGRTWRSSGETGCGKTTFVKLLTRLADPVSGRIVIGDVNLRDVAPDVRRRVDPDGAPGRVPVRRDRARERAVRARGRERPRRRDRVRGAGARRLGRGAPRRARHAGSASAARRSRSASGSSWRWSGPSSATRVC